MGRVGAGGAWNHLAKGQPITAAGVATCPQRTTFPAR